MQGRVSPLPGLRNSGLKTFFFLKYGAGWQAIMYLSEECVKPPHNSCQLTAALCKVHPDHNVTSVEKVGSSSLGGRRLKIRHCDVWIRGMTSGFSDHFCPDSSADGSSHISQLIVSSPSLSSSSSKCLVSALLRNKYNFLMLIYSHDYESKTCPWKVQNRIGNEAQPWHITDYFTFLRNDKLPSYNWFFSIIFSVLPAFISLFFL